MNAIYLSRIGTDAPTSQGIEPGAPCCVILYSDRHAATIETVKRFKTGKRAGQVREIIVREDTAIRTDTNGMSDAQTYRFERDPNGLTHRFTWSNFAWRSRGMMLAIGFRAQYYDYSF